MGLEVGLGKRQKKVIDKIAVRNSTTLTFIDGEKNGQVCM